MEFKRLPLAYGIQSDIEHDTSFVCFKPVECGISRVVRAPARVGRTYTEAEIEESSADPVGHCILDVRN